MAIWEAFTTNKQWESYLKQLVKTNDVALFRAIVLIYENQTEEEKYAGESVEDNKIGFSKYDARELSAIALKIKARKPLSKAEVARSRIKMPKYWRQLMVISKRRMAARKVLEEEIHQEMQGSIQPCSIQSKALIKCSDEGITCTYGICDECPNIKKNQE